MTEKNEAFWRVHDFCQKQYDELRQAANTSLKSGDAFAFTIFKAQQDAMRDVLSFMADVMHEDSSAM